MYSLRLFSLNDFVLFVFNELITASTLTFSHLYKCETDDSWVFFLFQFISSIIFCRFRFARSQVFGFKNDRLFISFVSFFFDPPLVGSVMFPLLF